MNKFEIDGNKLIENENEYLKETFDLPVFDGDYETIYQYLSGFYNKTEVHITNKDKIDPELIIAFERAQEDNSFVKVIIE